MARDNMTDDIPNLTEEDIKKISAKIEEVVDPAYKYLCELSAKLDTANVGGIEIQTPTGKFLWQPNFAVFNHNRKVN